VSGWHAVVPIKPPGARKTRLRGCLDAQAIRALTEHMLHHVLETLTRCPDIDRVTLLAEVPRERWTGQWFSDPGTGLNAALTALTQEMPDQVIVVHADLPGVQRDDITAMIAAAQAHGFALAPDRHGTGTNALALCDGRDFPFQFGDASRLRHRAMRSSSCEVHYAGLAMDVDLPEDLRLAVQQGVLPARFLPARDRLSD
jgi:2-phospho-L-lactate/phosphoenolpyruvate guanylyltransferase